MSDLISRQAAIDAADKIIERDTSGNNDVVKAMTAWKMYVESLPSAEPDKNKQKKGKWEQKEDPYGFFDTIPVCSVCGHTTKMRETYAYCPNCGAEMEVSE